MRDLDIPVRIEVCPTVREPTAWRCARATPTCRPPSASARSALSRALRAAEAEVAAGERRRRRRAGRRARGARRAGVEPEYLELRSADDLSPVERVNGSTLLAVAARVGRARLIDNTILGGTQ